MYTTYRRDKNLEKILFVNHKEDQNLNIQLDKLDITARLKVYSIELERLRIKSELRLYKQKTQLYETYSKQRNTQDISPQSKPTKLPTIDELDVMKSSRMPKPPVARQRPRQNSVNSYLLNEYRKSSQVIPSILHSMSKNDENGKNIARVVDPDDVVLVNPNLLKIRELVQAVKRLRKEVSTTSSCKIEKKSLRMHPEELFRNIYSQTDESFNEFTDGTCALLHRKLLKERRSSLPKIPDNKLLLKRYPVESPKPVSFKDRRLTSNERNSGEMKVGFPSIQRNIRQLEAARHIDTSNDASAHEAAWQKMRVENEQVKYDGIKERCDRFMKNVAHK